MIVSPKSISELRAKYHSLPPKMRKVAEHIISHPEQVINCSLQELSSIIGVSQYSVLCCVRAAGYSGYSDFKLSLALGLKSIGPGEGAQDKLEGDVLQETFESNARSLLDTAQIMEHKTFLEVTDRIFTAKRTGIYGLGYSAYAAQYLCVQLIRLGFHAIAITDATYQLLDAVTLIEADLLFGFSTSGKAESIVEAFRIARKNRCSTVAVTCVSDSPIIYEADYILLTTSSGPRHAMDTDNSIIEQISLASAIVTSVYNEFAAGRRRTV